MEINMAGLVRDLSDENLTRMREIVEDECFERKYIRGIDVVEVRDGVGNVLRVESTKATRAKNNCTLRQAYIAVNFKLDQMR